MQEKLEKGRVHEMIISAAEEHSASHYGNPGVDVFATPALVTLFENVCGDSLKPCLREGQFTVGAQVDIRHLGATALGMRITARSEIIEIDRRRVVFRVEAHDAVEKIGEGFHERYILDDLPQFLQKTAQKTANNPS